jgi:MerR family transcriptional regulator, light-induced transcriptional regulator
MNDVPSFLRNGIPAGMVETFAHLVLSPDESDAAALVEQLLDDGVPAESVMLDLLGPAARLLGEMWCGDEASFLDVTLGLSHIQRLMRQLRLPAGGLMPEQGSALLLPVPGEQHVLGLRMVEELLRRDGWRVRALHTAGEGAAGHAVAEEDYDFVGFSISGARLLPALRQAIREVRAQSRNPNVRIMVGGVAFSGQDRAMPPPDADAVVGDAHEAVAQARRWHALAGVN